MYELIAAEEVCDNARRRRYCAVGNKGIYVPFRLKLRYKLENISCFIVDYQAFLTTKGNVTCTAFPIKLGLSILRKTSSQIRVAHI